jgi:hypothetical protein
VEFSPKMMYLISLLNLDKSGNIAPEIMKLLKRHGKETKIDMAPILKCYMPEIFISKGNAIIISKKTLLDCAEGPFCLVSSYLELLNIFLHLEENEEREAIKNITQKFKKKHKKGVINFKRKAGMIRIRIIIPEDGKFRKFSLNYPAMGEGIRKKQEDIFCLI